MDLFPVRIDAGKVLVDTGPTKAVTRSEAKLQDVTPA
jgi:hypothetical protein